MKVLRSHQLLLHLHLFMVKKWTIGTESRKDETMNRELVI